MKAPEYDLSIVNDDSCNVCSLPVFSSQPQVDRWVQPIHKAGRQDSTLASVGNPLSAMPASMGREFHLGSLENGGTAFSFLRQRVLIRPVIGGIILLLLPNLCYTASPNWGQLGNADFAKSLSK
jgi:hypothetical protein